MYRLKDWAHLKIKFQPYRNQCVGTYPCWYVSKSLKGSNVILRIVSFAEERYVNNNNMQQATKMTIENAI